MRIQKRSPSAIAEAERIAKIMTLRKSGATFEQIGQVMGCTMQNAFGIVTRQLAKINAAASESTEEVRRLELERLDALMMGQWKQATGGHQGAVQAVLRIMERRAKILGLDAPTKIAPTTPDGLSGAALTITLPETWGRMEEPSE